MSKRNPYDLQMPLATWNGFLCIFSFIGMCRTVPHLMANILTQPFEDTVCTAPSDAWGKGSGLYFVAMNYTVHAMMYGYYCLQALKLCPKSFPAHLITISQIFQMFVGTGVCISAWYFKLSGSTCNNDMSNLLAGAGMYGSYLYLFCDFAFKRYKPGKKNMKKGEKKLE
eukprot:gene17831-23443_t